MGLFDDLPDVAEKPKAGLFDDLPDAPKAESDGSFTGEIGAGHYLNALKTGLGNVMSLPGKVALAAGGAQHGQFYWPTDEEVQAPLLPQKTVQDFITRNVDGQENWATGALRGIGNTVSGASSPENMALLGIAPEGKLAQRLIAGTFLGQSLLGTPEQWQAFKDATTAAEKTRIGVEMGLGLALPAAGLAHSFKGPKEGISAAPIPEAPTDNVQASRQNAVFESTRSNAPPTHSLSPDPQSFQKQSDLSQPESITGGDVNATRKYPEPIEAAPTFDPKRAASEAPSVPDANAAHTEGGLPPKASFVPSTVWQEIPEGVVLPNGGEYRFDQKSGKNFARWSQENLPSEVPAIEPPLTQTQEPSVRASEETGALPSKQSDSSQPDTSTARTYDASESTGIAQRVHDQRGVDVEPGAGISGADSVQHGRELLKSGVDPVARLQEMKQSGRLNSDDMAVLRAHHEELGKVTNAAENALRTNPSHEARQTYEHAWQAERNFAGEIKPFQTEWHKIGMAQQGEVDLVDGSYSSLRRMVSRDTGRDVLPHEEPKLRQAAGKVEQATRAEAAARTKLSEVVKEMTKQNKLPKTKEALQAHFAEKFKKMLPCS